ncbi:MAG: pilus assembly protein [Betaproteobacteria bacterium HGW-Betaproteobacteria-9]|jgi:hypothetical protein|nr:MAG: pilus assembly protein [Betaproteobacteria bacterium HGW-Betaproteobacteria-9]
MSSKSPNLFASISLKDRILAAGLHLIGSLAIAGVVALLVFSVWYPGEFRYLAGGTELLLLVMAVDVVMGPVLTFAVFNKAKGIQHLRRDIFIIAVLQMLALAYGLNTVREARPVALVFEFDRFRVISQSEVVSEELKEALPEFQALPLFGPATVALRRSESGAERSNALATAIFDGIDTSQRPKFWIPYGPHERTQAVTAGRPIEELGRQYPSASIEIKQLFDRLNIENKSAKFLPVNARKDAVAVLNVKGEILGFLPYDGFF